MQTGVWMWLRGWCPGGEGHGSILTNWEPLRDAGSQAPPQTCWVRGSAGWAQEHAF